MGAGVEDERALEGHRGVMNLPCMRCPADREVTRTAHRDGLIATYPQRHRPEPTTSNEGVASIARINRV